jgi:hypothetical protein
MRLPVKAHKSLRAYEAGRIIDLPAGPFRKPCDNKDLFGLCHLFEPSGCITAGHIFGQTKGLASGFELVAGVKEFGEYDEVAIKGKDFFYSTLNVFLNLAERGALSTFFSTWPNAGDV